MSAALRDVATLIEPRDSGRCFAACRSVSQTHSPFSEEKGE